MINQERLKELLTYDPLTGAFIWNDCTRKDLRGKQAGNIRKDGYRHIKIDGKSYYAQRLAFLYMTGSWPLNHVDHDNTIKHDNKWLNLREATRSQNMGNKNVAKTSRTGVKGITVDMRGRYRAVLRNKHIGMFATLEEAKEAWNEQAKKEYGQFFRA